MSHDAHEGASDEASRLKRQDLLRVARRHFMTEGYASARMEVIARDASASTATLYAFFPSKSALFSSVIEDASHDFASRMNDIAVTGDGVQEQLLAFAETYAAFMNEPQVRAVFRLVIAERRRFHDTARRFFEHGRREIGAGLMSVIETHAAKGVLNVRQPSWAAGQLMGMIEHPTFFAPMLTGDEVTSRRDPKEVARDAVETFLARYGTGHG